MKKFRRRLLRDNGIHLIRRRTTFGTNHILCVRSQSLINIFVVLSPLGDRSPRGRFAIKHAVTTPLRLSFGLSVKERETESREP